MSKTERYWIEMTPEPVLAAVRAWHRAAGKPAPRSSVEKVLSPSSRLEPIEERDLSDVLEQLIAAGEIRVTPEGYEAIGL
jgi:hypothetical protein